MSRGPETRTPTDRWVRWRVACIALAGVSLLSGLNAGLVRLGVWAPVASTRVGELHGPVMVLGFMGTLISLERAQALRNPLAYLAPTLLGAGAVALLAGAPETLGMLLLFDGTIAFLAVAVALWVRAPLPLVAAQALAVLFAVCAAFGLLVADLPAVIPLLAAYLILTIASERAELAQLTMGPGAVRMLLTVTAVVGAGAGLSVVLPDAGSRVLGLGAVLVSVWLIRDDVGRRMIRSRGLRRFNAAALLAGNVWLAVAGAIWLVAGAVTDGGAYDAVIHCVFLGFGVSMIMAHAPIIFPAVIGRALPYRAVMWIPLALLQCGLAVRTVGALTAAVHVYQVGGILTVVSMLAFAVTVIYSVVKG
ncbi:hypothetical protein [Tessaracoccus palaemonis]|uniref:hypothetical protein n=1 Tax=Tessaracoccus palaemonis TaxID=2829499 RepID=UPI002104F634|nr:hypothetical protein [Tessaracoccus palaemonis]